MTYEEACEQAKQLHKQGQDYHAIAKHFAETGYKSDRSGNPPKWNAVRYMIFKDQVKDKKREKDDARLAKRESKKADHNDEIKLVNPNQETLDALKAVAEMPKINEVTRSKIMRAILKQA